MNSWSHNYFTGSSLSDPEEHRKHVDPVDRELLKQKRYRSAYTTSQINYMEGVFKKHAYVDKTKRVHMAQILNLPERCIKIWFQNRRMKEKTSRDDMSKGETDKKNPDTIFRGNPVLSLSERNLCSLPKPLEAPLEIPKKPNAHTKIFKSGFTKQGTPITVMYPSYDYKEKANTHDVETKDNAKDDAQKEFRPNFYKDIPIDHNESSFAVTAESPPPPVCSDSNSDYKASAEFSIDLCKKYKDLLKNDKNDSLVNDKIEKNNNHVSQPFQAISVIKHTESETQDMPQDLSIKKQSSYQDDEAISLTRTPGNTPAVGPLYVDVNQTYYKPNGVCNSGTTYSPSYNLLTIDPSVQMTNHNDTNQQYTCNLNKYYERNIKNLPSSVAPKYAPPINTVRSNSSIMSRQDACSSQQIFAAQYTTAQSAPASPSHHMRYANHMGSAQHVSSLQNINSAHYINSLQHSTSVEHMPSAYTVKPQYALTLEHATPSADGNSRYPYKLNWRRI